MGSQFLIMTSMPVTISIILVWSQVDAGSLIQVERNKKALRRIQEKIMRAKSTLDWSQSNNISWSWTVGFGLDFGHVFRLDHSLMVLALALSWSLGVWPRLASLVECCLSGLQLLSVWVSQCSCGHGLDRGLKFSGLYLVFGLRSLALGLFLTSLVECRRSGLQSLSVWVSKRRSANAVRVYSHLRCMW